MNCIGYYARLLGVESNWDIDLPLDLSRGEQENSQSDRVGNNNNNNNNNSMVNHHHQPGNDSDKSHDKPRPSGVRLSVGANPRPESAKSEHPNPTAASNHTDNNNGNNTTNATNNTIHSSTQHGGLIEKSISNNSNLNAQSGGGGGGGTEYTRSGSLERGRPEKPAHTVLRSLGPLATENITPQQINILVGTLFSTHPFTHIIRVYNTIFLIVSYMHITRSRIYSPIQTTTQPYVKFYCRVSKSRSMAERVDPTNEFCFVILILHCYIGEHQVHYNRYHNVFSCYQHILRSYQCTVLICIY